MCTERGKRGREGISRSITQGLKGGWGSRPAYVVFLELLFHWSLAVIGNYRIWTTREQKWIPTHPYPGLRSRAGKRKARQAFLVSSSAPVAANDPPYPTGQRLYEGRPETQDNNANFWELQIYLFKTSTSFKICNRSSCCHWAKRDLGLSNSLVRSKTWKPCQDYFQNIEDLRRFPLRLQ